MDKTVVSHPQVLSWLRESILDPHVATFLAYLRDRRYARQTQHSYICAMAHFARWLSLEKTRLPHLNEQVVRRFFFVHLSRCSCPYPVLRTKHEIHAALRHLLAMLRASGVIPQRQNSDPISLELARFDSYMLDVRGLAISTRHQRVLIVRKFLLAQRQGKHFALGRISVNGVRAFVLSGYGKYSAGTVGVVGGALRCYLRFRAMEGDNIEHLREAVPSAAHWRLAGVPEVLSDQEVHALLNSFRKLEHSPKRPSTAREGRPGDRGLPAHRAPTNNQQGCLRSACRSLRCADPFRRSSACSSRSLPALRLVTFACTHSPSQHGVEVA